MVTYNLQEERTTGFTGNNDTIGVDDTRDGGIATEIDTTSAYELGKIEVRLRSFGSPTVSIVCDIFSDSTGLPNTLLATSNNSIDPTTLTGSFSEETFTFAPGTNLSTTTTYWFNFRRSDRGFDVSNNVVVDGEYQNAANGFNTARNDGPDDTDTWSTWTNDWAYWIKVYDQVADATTNNATFFGGGL